jgi:hypothetical protein
MGTHELLKQLDDAFKLCDQRTKDLELAARMRPSLFRWSSCVEARTVGGKGVPALNIRVRGAWSQSL